MYEEIVEGITRFFAIFQSTDAGPIGPIRSARTTDVDLLNQLNDPLFVWSGGNVNVVRTIGTANAESRAYGQAPGFYRDQARGRRADTEHTLMNEGTATVYGTAVEGQGSPAPFFTYRPVGTPVAGNVPVSTIDARMNSVPLNWTWDPAQGLWIRSEYGDAHVDESLAPISANNVVVQFVPYGASSADRRSPEAVTVGEGDAWIFTDGQLGWPGGAGRTPASGRLHGRQRAAGTTHGRAHVDRAGRSRRDRRQLRLTVTGARPLGLPRHVLHDRHVCAKVTGTDLRGVRRVPVH